MPNERECMPEVSIIIPFYNVEQYLDKCMESVIRQTMDDFEVILVDDGSKDNSLSFANSWNKRYPNKVSVYTQVNSGQGTARNNGVIYAQGEYILFVDSDDTVTENFVEEAYHAIISCDADMAVFDAVVVDEQGNKIEDLVGCHTDERVISLDSFPRILLEYPCPWNKIYKRSLFIDNDLKYPTHMWYEDLAGASMFYTGAKKIAVLHKQLYFYMQRTTSVMHSNVNPKNIEILRAMDIILDFYRQKGLYDKYYKELEYLGVYHVLIAAAGRTVRGDRKSKFPDQFMEYMDSHFPKWKQNPYIKELSKANHLKLWLLCRRWYRMLHILYKIGKNTAV